MPTEKPPRLLCGRCASTCEHSNQRMVKFTQQNGRLAYRHQCLTCSHGQGASRTRMSRTRARSGGATIRGPGNLPSPALAAGHGRHRTSPLGTAREFPGGPGRTTTPFTNRMVLRVDLARLSLGRCRWTARDQLIRVWAGYPINCRLRCRPPGLAIEDQQGNHEQRPGN
jgi:hypothetical protein